MWTLYLQMCEYWKMISLRDLDALFQWLLTVCLVLEGLPPKIVVQDGWMSRMCQGTLWERKTLQNRWSSVHLFLPDSQNGPLGLLTFTEALPDEVHYLEREKQKNLTSPHTKNKLSATSTYTKLHRTTNPKVVRSIHAQPKQVRSLEIVAAKQAPDINSPQLRRTALLGWPPFHSSAFLLFKPLQPALCLNLAGTETFVSTCATEGRPEQSVLELHETWVMYWACTTASQRFTASLLERTSSIFLARWCRGQTQTNESWGSRQHREKPALLPALCWVATHAMRCHNVILLPIMLRLKSSCYLHGWEGSVTAFWICSVLWEGDVKGCRNRSRLLFWRIACTCFEYPVAVGLNLFCFWHYISYHIKFIPHFRSFQIFSVFLCTSLRIPLTSFAFWGQDCRGGPRHCPYRASDFRGSAVIMHCPANKNSELLGRYVCTYSSYSYL